VTSRAVVLAVVIGLALIAVVVVTGGLVLAGMDKSVPDSIIVIGASAAGALGGVLASTRSTLGPNDTEPSTFSATVVRTSEAVGNPQGTTP
jgi:hypothetical protein